MSAPSDLATQSAGSADSTSSAPLPAEVKPPSNDDGLISRMMADKWVPFCKNCFDSADLSSPYFSAGAGLMVHLTLSIYREPLD